MESKGEENKADLHDSGCYQGESPPVKQIKLDTESQQYLHLLNFSDDVLLNILKYCSAMDLKAVGATCVRFATLVQDRTLWNVVDMSSVSVGGERVRWLINNCLHENTTCVKIRGFASNIVGKCMGHIGRPRCFDLVERYLKLIDSVNSKNKGSGDGITVPNNSPQELKNFGHLMFQCMQDYNRYNSTTSSPIQFYVNENNPNRWRPHSYRYDMDTDSECDSDYELSEISSMIVEHNRSLSSEGGISLELTSESSNADSDEASGSMLANSDSSIPIDTSNNDVSGLSKSTDGGVRNTKRNDSVDATSAGNDCANPSTVIDDNVNNPERNDSGDATSAGYDYSNPSNVIDYNVNYPERNDYGEVTSASNGCANPSNVQNYIVNNPKKNDSVDATVAGNYCANSSNAKDNNVKNSIRNVPGESAGAGPSNADVKKSDDSTHDHDHPFGEAKKMLLKYKANLAKSLAGRSAGFNSLQAPIDVLVELECPGPCYTPTMRLTRTLQENCPNLTVLKLEYCVFRYPATSISQFPRTLKELSLRGTMIFCLPFERSFLFKINEILPDLEELDVSECEWLAPNVLVALGKLSKLRVLIMRDCPKMSEFVAYASLSARYGFRKIQVMDLRGTPFGDSEMASLSWLPVLEELYCSPPAKRKVIAPHAHFTGESDCEIKRLEDWEIEANPENITVDSPLEDSDETEDCNNHEPNEAHSGRGGALSFDSKTVPTITPFFPKLVPTLGLKRPASYFRSNIANGNGTGRRKRVKTCKVTLTLDNDELVNEGASTSKDNQNQQAGSSNSGNAPNTNRIHLHNNREEENNADEQNNRDVPRVRVVPGLDFEPFCEFYSSLGSTNPRSLITDAAVRSFGRSDSANVRYVVIGGTLGSEDKRLKTNLRILSVTGYYEITDESLYHLVTAAPKLVYLNVSDTSVTRAGIDYFKNMRRDCKLVHSIKSRNISEYKIRF